MLSANETTKLPRERKPSTSKHETERERLFWKVIRAYRKRSQSLIRRKPDPTGRRKKRTAKDADFVKDVESAARFALQGTGLLAEWQRIANDNVWQAPSVMRQVIGRCARVYRERGLSPDCYFREKSNIRKRYPHKSLGKNWFCELHDLQAITECFKDAAGKIVRLQCGCERREDIAAAVPVRGAVVSIDELPATAFLPFGDDTAMLGGFGTAA